MCILPQLCITHATNVPPILEFPHICNNSITSELLTHIGTRHRQGGHGNERWIISLTPHNTRIWYYNELNDGFNVKYVDDVAADGEWCRGLGGRSFGEVVPLCWFPLHIPSGDEVSCFCLVVCGISVGHICDLVARGGSSPSSTHRKV